MTRPLLPLAAALLLAAGSGAPEDWVELRRGPCFGNCPVYEVTLRADGTATYRGGDFAPRQGQWGGTVDPQRVERLLARLDSAGFWSMPRDRQLRIIDLPQTVLRARAGGREHAVHTNLTPEELAPLHAAIDSVADGVVWRRPAAERPRTVAVRGER